MTDDNSESNDDAQRDDQPADPAPTGTVDVEVDPDSETDADETTESPSEASPPDQSDGIDRTAGDEAADTADAPGTDELLDKDPEEVTEEDIEHLPEEQQEQVRSFLGLGDDDESDDDTGADDPMSELQREAERQERASKTDTSSSDPGEDLEPGTLAETGLTDDEDNFSWEDEFDETEWGEQSEEYFTYKGTDFSMQEPENTQKIENAARHLENADDMSDERRKRAMFSYYDDLVDACLRVGEDTPLSDAYVVRKSGRKLVATENEVPVDLSSDPDATPLWEAGTEMDKMIMGRRVDRFVSGEDRFRQRSR